jgi:5'-phosphate synthase pdxT subunit
MIVCDRDHLGLIDASARRNAFGRQIASFEADLEIEGIGPDPLRAVFIRAPWIERHGSAVEVLAELDRHPVAIRQGPVLAVSFHPELTDDSRIHALLMAMATASRERAQKGAADGTRGHRGGER